MSETAALQGLFGKVLLKMVGVNPDQAVQCIKSQMGPECFVVEQGPACL